MMKEFKIYANPLGSYQAVKQGWSWPAFFFGVIWSLAKRLWVLSIGVFLSFFIIGFISNTVGGELGKAIDTLTTLAALVMGIFFGAYGNQWREANLLSRGFECMDDVSAANSESAIALYLKNHTKNLYI
jgi:hypothetical protein